MTVSLKHRYSQDKFNDYSACFKKNDFVSVNKMMINSYIILIMAV